MSQKIMMAFLLVAGFATSCYGAGEKPKGVEKLLPYQQDERLNRLVRTYESRERALYARIQKSDEPNAVQDIEILLQPHRSIDINKKVTLKNMQGKVVREEDALALARRLGKKEIVDLLEKRVRVDAEKQEAACLEQAKNTRTKNEFEKVLDACDIADVYKGYWQLSDGQRTWLDQLRSAKVRQKNQLLVEEINNPQATIVSQYGEPVIPEPPAVDYMDTGTGMEF